MSASAEVATACRHCDPSVQILALKFPGFWAQGEKQKTLCTRRGRKCETTGPKFLEALSLTLQHWHYLALSFWLPEDDDVSSQDCRAGCSREVWSRQG